MDRYKFKSHDADDFSSRSKFANNVLKLVWQIHGGDLTTMADDVEMLYNSFYDHVKGICDDICEEIPLFALLLLKKYGTKDYGLTEEEIDVAFELCVKACKQYYNVDNR